MCRLAARIGWLVGRFPGPAISDEVTHEQARIWQSYATAGKLFQESMDQTASALGTDRELSLDEFWQEAQIILAATLK